jgi:AcrR family transcriptional regulator
MSRVTTAHLEARRQSILDAAGRVFARRGIMAATMAEIADEAGISPGAIYRYYTSKEMLAAECMREGPALMAAEWHRVIEGSADPMDTFYGIARNAFDEINDACAEDDTRLMLEEALSVSRSRDLAAIGHLRGKREIIVRGLQEALQKAQDADQLPASLNTYHLAQALCAFYTGVRVARLMDPSIDSDAQLAEVRALIDLARGAAPAS